jgi:hypothetical protein
VTCHECRIVTEEIALLGQDTPPGIIPNENMLAARDSRGRFYLHSYDAGVVNILVFDSRGNFLLTIASQGEGPGEYQLISAIRPLDEGRIVIYDAMLFRATFLSADYRVLNTVRWQIPPNWTILHLDKRSDRILMSSDWRIAGRVGIPLHLIDDNGEVIRSFGTDSSGAAVYPGSPRVERRIALSETENVWVARTDHYEIELWSMRGELLRQLQRDSLNPDSTAAERKPRNAIASVYERDGLLWVFMLVADPRWDEQLIPSDDAHGERFVGTRREYRDTIVEVIKPETGELLARQRIDEVLFPIEPGMVGAVTWADEGSIALRYGVWAVRLER